MTANSIEIERKFLVLDDSYKAQASSCVRIRQGYLCLQSNCTVRVRQWGDTAFLTIKGKPAPGSIARYEFEKEISPEDADRLFMLALPGVVEKRRWMVPMPDGLVCEVDEFEGANAGLTVAEVELKSETQAFERLAFMGQEVTYDHRYKNSYLSQRPYTTWPQ